MLVEWVRYLTERALAPYSVRAFLFAVVCVAAATALRYTLGLFQPNVLSFAAYYPTVLLVALLAGSPAAILATALSIVSVALFFDTSPGTSPLKLLNYIFFALACALIVLVAQAYRQLIRLYQTQARQKNLMLRELEHRGKNTFAVVEAIVLQTLSDDRATAEIITARIRAVSSTNDIISHAADLQPDLRTLIRAKFEPFGNLRASFAGPETELPSDTARNLSLVFHELVTNAIKHGALSTPEGRVDIAWTADDGALSIKWVERGGPHTSPPARSGFGTKLVVGVMKSLGGRVEADFPPAGLVCTITIPREKAPA